MKDAPDLMRRTARQAIEHGKFLAPHVVAELLCGAADAVDQAHADRELIRSAAANIVETLTDERDRLRKVLLLAASLLSEEKMKEEAQCYAVYSAYLEAVEALRA